MNLSGENPTTTSTAAVPWGMAYLDLDGFQVDRDLIAAFPAKTLFETGTLPLDRSGDRVRVAVSDPHNFAALDELTAFSGFLLEPSRSRSESDSTIAPSNTGRWWWHGRRGK